MTPADTLYTQILPFASDPELAHRYLVLDQPLKGNIRFGLLLEVLDKVAEQTALGYVHRFFPEARVVTAAIDDIVIRQPAETTQDLKFSACLNHVGKSSMEVGVRVEHIGATPYHVASCYFTMVARSTTAGTGSGVVLPPLQYVSDLERHRYDKAEARRQAYRDSLERAEEMPTHEEFLFLRRLHKEQEPDDFAGLRAGQLVIESYERMYPSKEYNPSMIFGGYLVNRAFQLAAIAAEKVAPSRAIIARVNRINFLSPMRIGSTIKVVARVVYSSRTTVTVQVEIEQYSRDKTSKALANSCLFTFRSVDADLQPLPVPFIYPVTYAEDARFLFAYRQRLD